MFKKISALFLAAVMLLGAAPAYARLTITDADEQLEVLKALGVTKELPYAVSEGVFMEYLAGLMYNEVNMETAEFAEMMGMVASRDEFNASGRITYAKALEYCVIALGYKVKAETDGGYYKTANDLGITDNISVDQDDTVTGSAAGQLIINMLEVEPLRKGIENGQIIYKTATDETILSLNRDIITVEGIVTANSVTGLTDATGVNEGEIEIDGVVYEADGSFDGLLGKTVYGFIKQDLHNDDTVIFLHEKKNKNNMLELKAEQLVDLDAGYLRYTPEENALSTKRAKLSETLRVIYNGVFCGDYTDADLLPENGILTLIDNNSDKTYDVAMITVYQTMVVASAISENEVLINSYKFDTALDTVTLDMDDDEHIVKIYGDDGREISFSDIKANDILSIAESRSTSPKVITVYKSSSVIEGIMKNKDSEEEIITVDETEYPYLEELELDIAEEGKTLNVGKKYRFYLDYFGNIVYVKYVNELDYYVFYKVVDADGDYNVSYMDMNENWNKAPLAKKVTIDDETMATEPAYENLSYYQPQVAKLFFNSKGELKEIKFAKASATADEGKFTKKEVSSKAYRTTPKTFESVIWLEDDAMLFVFPENLSDKSKYSARAASGAFTSDAEYTITAYDFDEYGFTNLISVNDGDNKKKVQSTLFLVTSVRTICVDDELLSCVKGVCGDFTVYQLTGEDENTFSGVEPGDVIRVHTNRNGRVDEVSTPIKTTISDFVKKRGYDYTTVYNRGDVMTATVKKIDLAEKKIMLDVGEDAVFRLKDSIVVTIYDRADKTCERGTVADLTFGDRVVCKTSYLQLQEIFVVRN